MTGVDHQFEPMTLGAVLDRSFRLYTQNFPLMLGITAIVHAPLLLLSLAPLFSVYLGDDPLLQFFFIFSSTIISLVSLVVVYPLVTGATTKAVSDKYLGNPVTIGSALKEAWSCIGTLLLTQIVAGLIVMLGFMLLIVPGVLWMLSYALIPPVVMIEAATRRLAPGTIDRADIRRRSWQLVKGNRGKVFLVLVVITVMQLLLSGGGDWLLGLALTESGLAAILRAIISSIVNVVLTPFQTIAITLLYYDFRIRKEGFDLEMLSAAMGAPSVNA